MAGTIVAACRDCHPSTADRTVLGCAVCHAAVDLQPTPAQAHVLVPDFDPSATSTTASALCARCHGDGTVPVKVAAHAAFPITTGFHSGADGGKCLSCHSASRTDPHKTFAADFTQPNCIGCHVATKAVVAGFDVLHDDTTALATFHAAANQVFDSTATACLGCHPGGSGGAPIHVQDDLDAREVDPEIAGQFG